MDDEDVTEPLSEYFGKRQNVLTDLGVVRKLYKKSTTVEEARAANKAFGLMYLYCPPDMTEMVLGAKQEFTIRMNSLFGYNWEID